MSLSGEVLDAQWRAFVDAARSACPDVAFDDAEFVAHVMSREKAGLLPAIAHAGDLLLAFACARGIPAAVAAFHHRYGSLVARVLSRRRADSADAADVSQAVFEKLLVGSPGGAPKIADYRGEGPLRSWIATTVATTLLMARRAAGRRSDRSDEGALALALETANPELLYMKSRYRAEIEAAIARALTCLGHRERMLLKLHFVERMTIDQLGSMYAVNRATTARWLAAARTSLLALIRDEIQAKLGVSRSECDSLVALVRSTLHVSAARHLAEGP
jgi:RNA polymerase sigma-70 factor (ECF subfamily)